MIKNCPNRKTCFFKPTKIHYILFFEHEKTVSGAYIFLYNRFEEFIYSHNNHTNIIKPTRTKTNDRSYLK